jgi:hypothetical protein
MKRPTRLLFHPRTLSVLGGVALISATSGAALAQPASPSPERVLTVLTRNLYIGSDFTSIFVAKTPLELLLAVQAAYAQIQATNFPERAKALANEIEQSKPDLIGLQEVSLIRTDSPSDGLATPASTVAYDYLDLTRRAGRARADLPGDGSGYRAGC